LLILADLDCGATFPSPTGWRRSVQKVVLAVDAQIQSPYYHDNYNINGYLLFNWLPLDTSCVRSRTVRSSEASRSPRGVDAAQVEAKYANGMLEVNGPRAASCDAKDDRNQGRLIEGGRGRAGVDRDAPAFGFPEVDTNPQTPRSG
jgi:hypothetical protein